MERRNTVDSSVGWDAKSNVNLLTLVQLLQKNRGSMYQLLLYSKKKATTVLLVDTQKTSYHVERISRNSRGVR